jgi:hypothetical protein
LFQRFTLRYYSYLGEAFKVYLLRGTKVLKKLRRENKLWKPDEVDAMLLSKILRDMFRTLTLQEMEEKVKLQPLINEYEPLSRRTKILKH